MKLEKLRADKGGSAKYMCDQITHICKTFEKRPPGSTGEEQAVNYMAAEAALYCDDIKVEPFKVFPAAFTDWIYITVSCHLLAFAGYFFSTLISVLLILIGFLPMLVQFLLYKRMTDPLYKECLSHNLTAVKRCGGEVKRRIFFCGHADATNEYTTNYKFGGTMFRIQVLSSVAGALYILAISIARWISVGGLGAGLVNEFYLYLGLSAIIFLPSMIANYFLINKKVVVDGANDNLSGCYVGLALLKALKDNGIEFENTEVGVIITGSEEAGLRGAKAWCAAHKTDYEDAETIFVCMDIIRDRKFLQVNRRDLNGLVKCDRSVADMFLKAAQQVNVVCGEGSVPFSATDAAAFCQNGFRCVSVTAIDHQMPNYYHTRYDSYDNISADCLADCFEVAVQMLENYSEKD